MELPRRMSYKLLRFTGHGLHEKRGLSSRGQAQKSASAKEHTAQRACVYFVPKQLPDGLHLATVCKIESTLFRRCLSWESIMDCANLQCSQCIANMKLLTCASVPIRCVDKALARREARKLEPLSKALHIQSIKKRT